MCVCVCVCVWGAGETGGETPFWMGFRSHIDGYNVNQSPYTSPGGAQVCCSCSSFARAHTRTHTITHTHTHTQELSLFLSLSLSVSRPFFFFLSPSLVSLSHLGLEEGAEEEEHPPRPPRPARPLLARSSPADARPLPVSQDALPVRQPARDAGAQHVPWARQPDVSCVCVRACVRVA